MNDKKYEVLADRLSIKKETKNRLIDMGKPSISFMRVMSEKASADAEGINDEYISRIAAEIKYTANRLKDTKENQQTHIVNEVKKLAQSVKESRVMAISIGELSSMLSNVKSEASDREPKEIKNLPFKSVMVIQGSPLPLFDFENIKEIVYKDINKYGMIIAWILTEGESSVSIYYMRDGRSGFIIMENPAFQEAICKIVEGMISSPIVAPTPGQVRKWKLDKGRKVLPPPPFYKVKVPEFISQKSENSEVTGRQLNWRHDRRSHYRLLVRTDEGELDQKYVNGFKLRGYDVFQPSENLPEEINIELSHKGKEKKDGFWIAIKQVKVKSTIVGPESSKYIPAQRGPNSQ